MHAIDLFAGAGGMSVGAIKSGITVKYAVELDRIAATTFSNNHTSTKMVIKDVRMVHRDELIMKSKTPTMVFGGPPCQGFSTSNQRTRNSENLNNWLFKDYLRLVKDLRPDWVVFENVKGLLETENGFFFEHVLAGLKKAGYKTTHFVLNSIDYGVPQSRSRLFIIGSWHGVEVKAPVPLANPILTVNDAFNDLPILLNGNSTDELKYRERAQTSYSKKLRGKLRKCSGHLVTNNAAHILARYRYIPQGGNWEDIPYKLMANYADRERCHTGIYHRLSSSKPSVVIGNFRKNMLIHPSEDRGLSVREAARLQSFPDSFKFVGSIGFQQQQVGNAVPPLLAEAVFRQVLNHS